MVNELTKKERIMRGLRDIPDDLIEAAYVCEVRRGEKFQAQMDYASELVKKYLLDIEPKLDPNGFIKFCKVFGDTKWRITMT